MRRRLQSVIASPEYLLTVLLLAGCLASSQGTSGSASPSALDSPSRPTVAAEEPPSPPADPDAPAVLLERSVGAGTLYLIRYPSAGQTCLSITFNPHVLEVQRCGPFSGTGVGWLDTLTDPAGQPVRVAYGLALAGTITAVAVEYTGGGNDNTLVQNGGYLFMLREHQTPRRAVGINQYGNMVGSWTFRP